MSDLKTNLPRDTTALEAPEENAEMALLAGFVNTDTGSFSLSHLELQQIIALISETGGTIVINIPSRANRIADANLDAAVAPVLAKYREHVSTLRPGERRDIYPWHTPEHVVMEAARRLRNEGWKVDRRPYQGSLANYSGGNLFIRVTAPASLHGSGNLLSRIIAALRWLIDGFKF